MMHRWFTLTVLCCLLTGSAVSQEDLLMKLQLMPDGQSWGVYLRPDGISPSDEVLTASGQVTVVMPEDFVWIGPFDVNGQWANNATVVSPIENTERKYVSFGLVQAEPLYPIPYNLGEDILLFTFEAINCPDSIFLIDCNSASGVTDPFCPDFPDSTPLSNSVNSNPGNELSVLDFGNGFQFYGYEDNFAHSAWSCHDCDGDGIPNALEDTNGNGMYDPDEDVSNLCDIDCTVLPVGAHLTGDATICAGEEAELAVQIDGGQGPFTLVVSDGTSEFTFENYESGAPITMTPQEVTDYSIVSITASPVCVLTENLGLPVTVNVVNALSISAVPANIAVCEGGEASFTATALNESGLTTYAVWQRSCDQGTTWEDVTLVGESTELEVNGMLTVSDITASLDGCQYRFNVWTDNCGAATSDAAQLTVDQSVSISQQPADQMVCQGESAIFETVVSDADGVAFQWQQSCDGGATWADVDLTDENFQDAQSASLTILESNENISGCQFRLMASASGCAATYTDAAELTVAQPATIISHPTDFTVCPGDIVQFTAEAEAEGNVIYQWQLSVNGLGYIDIPGPNPLDFDGFNTPTLTVNNIVPSMDGFKFRLLAASDVCPEPVYSEVADLSIPQNIFVAQSPENQTVCEGSPVELSAQIEESGQDAVTYQWQLLFPGGANWIGLSDDPVFSGTATEQLSIASIDGLENVQFRLEAVGACQTVVSEAAEVFQEISTSILAQPTDYVACPGENTHFTAEVEAGANASYHWEWSIAGQDYQPLESVFVGWNTPSVTVEHIWQDMADDLEFRLRIDNEICGESVYSEPVSFEVLETVEVLQSPDNQSDCDGEPATFFATIDEAGQDDVAYQWQQRMPGSTDWYDLSDDQVFSGTDSEELFVASNSGLDGTSYRLLASGICETAVTETALLTIDECFVDSGFVDISLKLLPDGDGWGVWIRPSEGYVPHPITYATSGRVVIGGSAGWGFHGLLNHAGGTWTPSTVLLEGPQNPNSRYFTFELTPNNNALNLAAGEEIMLFSFKNIGDCPEKIFILEGAVPNGLQPCTFSGVEFDEDPFYLGEVYDHGAANCNAGNSALMTSNAMNGQAEGGSEIIDSTPEQDLNLAQPNIEFVSNELIVSELRLSPNPAGEYVNLSFGNIEGVGKAQIRLLNLQGQPVQVVPVTEQTGLELQLTDLPTGFYFVTLEVDGKVVQREKLVKK